MSGWSNGRWWVLDSDRNPIHGPVGSMGECQTWLGRQIGPLPRQTRNEPGLHEYASGHFIIEESGYGAVVAAQEIACPHCFLVHAGECL